MLSQESLYDPNIFNNSLDEQIWTGTFGGIFDGLVCTKHMLYKIDQNFCADIYHWNAIRIVKLKYTSITQSLNLK